jgi:hypothetical protein
MITAKRIYHWLIFIFVLAACTAPPEETPTATPSPSSPVTGLVEVVALDIRQLESFPVQIQVIAEGILPDSCTTIERIDRNKEGNTFRVTMHTIRASGVACVENEIPFTETINLDVLGLSAGTYTVQVNSISGMFTLQVDNISDESNGVISGRLWHDLCAVSEAGNGSEGCVEREDGGFIADGVFEDEEPGLGGIVVNLGEGVCPAVGLGTTITDEAGFYLFSGLPGGDYCVSVDLENDVNASLLIPGEWSNTAENEEGEISVVLEPAENRDDANFGWDYQFLPSAENTEGECVDDILFTADITVPDETVIEAGETFTKTWELLNNGSCTWGSGYSLVFTAGEQMGSPDTQPLGQTVEPNETIELSVTLVAPTEPGNYRGEWKLRSANGVLFGIGVEADDPFWIQITVE